jgi:hypothetical protein
MENSKKIELDDKITGIYLEINGAQKIKIQDLCKKDYEEFLDNMYKLRCAYLSIVNKRN